jgi:hypothetical protein
MSDTISFISIINIIFRESMRPERDECKTKTAATATTVTLQRYFTQKCHTSDVVSEKDYPRIHIAGKVMRVPSPNTKVMYFVSLHEPGKPQWLPSVPVPDPTLLLEILPEFGSDTKPNRRLWIGPKNPQRKIKQVWNRLSCTPLHNVIAFPGSCPLYDPNRTPFPGFKKVERIYSKSRNQCQSEHLIILSLAPQFFRLCIV